MTDSGTIILTSPRPDLKAVVVGSCPEVRLLTIGEQPPTAPINGMVWCFVDWLLPAISGLEMCRRLRENPATANSKIVMVLDDDDREDRRRALRGGADDYLVGPLTPTALMARLKHYQPGALPLPRPLRLVHGEITADVATLQARWRGTPVPISPNEFRLLVHFIEHPDQVFSRQSLIRVLGKAGGRVDERTVDVWVGRLRRALRAHGAPDPLRTVRSVGYVLDGIQNLN